MKLFSYVVARDFGFAPNPFFGFCTLACCKPDIRRTAEVGDWVAGIGSMKKGLGYQLVYAMKISEIITFNDYWRDSRFFLKRPKFDSSIKHSYGDNIYHKDARTNRWIQEDSHHSLERGETNEANLDRDTGSTDKVIISKRFAYWGRFGPVVPPQLENLDGQSIFIRTSAHKCKFTDEFVRSFVDWFESFGDQGACAPPGDWRFNPK